jgi:hypothetical protein
MNRQHVLTIVAVLSLSLVAACNKDKKEADKAPSQPKAAPSAAVAAPPTAAAPTPGAAIAIAKAAAPVTAPAAAVPATASTGCAKLFAVSGKQLDTGKISCIEGAMEAKGHEFDSKACNGLENAWPVGMGDFKVLWTTCQAEQKFDDTACNAVLAKCF